MMKDWKNISYFKRAILIGSRNRRILWSDVTKIKGTESYKKNERNLFCLKQVLLEKIKPAIKEKKNSKVVVRDHSGQFPVQY